MERKAPRLNHILIYHAVLTRSEQEPTDSDRRRVESSPMAPCRRIFRECLRDLSFEQVDDKMAERPLRRYALPHIEVAVERRVERHCSFNGIADIDSPARGFACSEVDEIDLRSERADYHLTSRKALSELRRHAPQAAVGPFYIKRLACPSAAAAPAAEAGVAVVGVGLESPVYFETRRHTVEPSAEISLPERTAPECERAWSIGVEVSEIFDSAVDAFSLDVGAEFYLLGRGIDRVGQALDDNCFEKTPGKKDPKALEKAKLFLNEAKDLILAQCAEGMDFTLQSSDSEKGDEEWILESGAGTIKLRLRDNYSQYQVLLRYDPR